MDLRPAFDKLGLTARLQGARPTCSVITVAGALEFAVAKRQGQTPRLSVEFLNWAANQACGDKADGGFFSDLWRGFVAYGICAETAMPYEAEFDSARRPSAAALENARTRLSLTRAALSTGGRAESKFLSLLTALFSFLLWNIPTTAPSVPSYAGRTIEQWVVDCEALDPAVGTQAMMSVRSIGTNALPALTCWMAHRDPNRVRWFRQLLQSRESAFPWSLHHAVWSRSEPGYEYRALLGFKALGPAARPALPFLEHLIRERDHAHQSKAMAAARAYVLVAPSQAEQWVLGTNHDDLIIADRLEDALLLVGNPAFKSRAESRACAKAITAICLAARTWAMDHGGIMPTNILCMSNLVSNPKLLSGGDYEIVAPGLGKEDTNTIFMRCKVHGNLGYSGTTVFDGTQKHQGGGPSRGQSSLLTLL